MIALLAGGFLRTIWRDAQLYAMLAGELRLRRLARTLQVASFACSLAAAVCLLRLEDSLLWALPAWMALVTVVFAWGGLCVICDELNRRCAETLDYFAREEEA